MMNVTPRNIYVSGTECNTRSRLIRNPYCIYVSTKCFISVGISLQGRHRCQRLNLTLLTGWNGDVKPEWDEPVKLSDTLIGLTSDNGRLASKLDWRNNYYIYFISFRHEETHFNWNFTKNVGLNCSRPN